MISCCVGFYDLKPADQLFGLARALCERALRGWGSQILQPVMTSWCFLSMCGFPWCHWGIGRRRRPASQGSHVQVFSLDSSSPALLPHWQLEGARDCLKTCSVIFSTMFHLMSSTLSLLAVNYTDELKDPLLLSGLLGLLASWTTILGSLICFYRIKAQMDFDRVHKTLWNVSEYTSWCKIYVRFSREVLNFTHSMGRGCYWEWGTDLWSQNRESGTLVDCSCVHLRTF